MFARSDRSAKQHIVGYLGVVVGAALILLSASGGRASAAPAPKLDKLTLTALCTLPKGDAVFRVGNTNSVDVSYTWDIDKTSFSGSGTAQPGHSYLYVPPSHNNVRLYVGGKQELAPKQDADLCVFHVHPVKLWVDAEGHELESPDVPKFWTLTLESDIETLVCTWKKADVFCKSKADLEEKGEFAVEKRVLDVPFGSGYMITESATPGFEQKGTGPFGPIATPQDLTAFFDGDQDIVVTVTNQLVEEVVVATTTAAPTTTAASTTSTSVEEESTTSTTAGDEETTTTTSTSVGEESTTSTTAGDEETTTTTSTSVGEESTTSTTAGDEETTTSTTIESLITGESVTTAPTTTEASTSTLAPSTTLAPASTLSASTTTPADGATSTSDGKSHAPESSQLLPSDDRAPELAGDEVEPAASVGPSVDSLPVTGGPAGLVAGLGFALVVAGLAVLGFAWGSATPGRHAKRRWARL